MGSKKERLILTKLIEVANKHIIYSIPLPPGPDSILSPREAFYDWGTCASLQDYADYLESFNVANLITYNPTLRELDGYIEFRKWSDLKKLLAHLVYMGPISQKKAVLVYHISRLASDVSRFNKSRKTAPYIGSIKSLSIKGGEYSTYYLTNIKPA